MKKKTLAVTAIASCIALTVSFTGCSLVSTNNKADMAQEIAKVNITDSQNFKDSNLAKYADALEGDAYIYKREAVSYFLNVGYSWVQNYNYSYEDAFNMIIDSLIQNKVLVQYSTAALLDLKVQEDSGALEEFKAIKGENDKKTKIAKYEYLLDEDEIRLATYNLYSLINTAIDREEKKDIDEENGYTGTATRTTPVNLETEQDDYYPKNEDGSLNYNIYTGLYIDDNHNYRLDNSGAYKDDALEGTDNASRVKAYNAYLKSLKDNDLITEEDEKSNRKDVLSLSYLDDEYITQLESRIIAKYIDIYEEQQGEKLLDENAQDGSYIQNRYEEYLNEQTKNYGTATAFDSAMSGMSSSSFLLYSPDTSEDNELEDAIEGYSEKDYGRFGYVYNILLPFSARQTVELNGLKNILSEDENDDAYYIERNKLLKEIKTEDQRSAWFNGATNYSFKVSESSFGKEYYGDSDYLFFEGNLTESGEGARYKQLQAYDGRYAYNGKVFENKDGSYTLLGNELDIDGMLKEFSAYINFALGTDNAVTFEKGYNPDNGNEAYYNTDEFTFKNEDGDDEIDYTKFLYAYGSVDLGGFNNADLMNANAASNQYKVMSAVNELQFAYTTDTSVLSQYAGYSVSAYETSYIKEFEYAAKLAISKGAGAFTVCAGDYGWHLIYVTDVFDGGATYTPDWSRVKEEGTFENLFFEWIKGNDRSDISSTHRSKIISDFSKENESVVKYQERYKNLLDLDKNSN